ncbi:hypothetical protein RvY_07335-2 [Ramazzottius varieornatus]|uniref:Uncharacterized protein n=1 Tax=Ramazzottius varieornatus TaxID=947166 RepID=A0A1D1V4Y5_RAMVA|nr:hypothetical protein RvY_07335-2 [Ramazzottius varieornatus]
MTRTAAKVARWAERLVGVFLRDSSSLAEPIASFQLFSGMCIREVRFRPSFHPAHSLQLLGSSFGFGREKQCGKLVIRVLYLFDIERKRVRELREIELKAHFWNVNNE